MIPKNLMLFRSKHRIYSLVWLLMALHVGVQSAQGYLLYKQAAPQYEQVAVYDPRFYRNDQSFLFEYMDR